jgi:hypothetical protein
MYLFSCITPIFLAVAFVPITDPNIPNQNSFPVNATAKFYTVNPSEVFDLKPTSVLPSFVIKSGDGNHSGTP